MTSEHQSLVHPNVTSDSESGLAWQVGGGQGGSWTLGAEALPLKASCCQPSWTDSMETGDPETEINCQVSGAEGGGYVTASLCVPVLGGGCGGSRKQL